MTFTLLSWNVAGRVKNQPRQAEAILAEGYDVICLQEVGPISLELWRRSLARAGYRLLASELPPDARGSRRLGVLIATRSALRPVVVPGLPWPERHLAASTRVDGGTLEIHTLHAPLSSKEGEVKVRTLEALFGWLAEGARPGAPGPASVLAGDLNTPQYESRDGEIQTFARTRAGHLRPTHGERHDRAELALIEALPALGWRDAFRFLHGYERRDRSWKVGRHPGYRLDHLISSPTIQPLACDYVHAVREAGLSDHSAIWAELAL